MKRIGMLGGMSWESTKEYYRLLNEGVRAEKGGLHSAPLLLHSFDFAEIARLQHEGRWDTLAGMLADAARHMEAAGAVAIIICTNLMHKVAPAVEASISVPLLHIADAVGAAITAQNIRKVALLGTIFTMQEPFYRARLEERFGIEVIIPAPQDAAEVNRSIYEELCRGVFTEETRARYLDIIARLQEDGAEGVIMGCTEIPILLEGVNAPIPLFDTTALHAQAALNVILSPEHATQHTSTEQALEAC